MRLVSIMKKTPSVDIAVDATEASIGETEDGNAPTVTDRTVSMKEDPFDVEEGGDVQGFMSPGKMIGTSTMQTVSCTKSNSSHCPCRGENDCINTSTTSGNKESPDIVVKTNSASAERTEIIGKKKDSTSKKKVSCRANFL